MRIEIELPDYDGNAIDVFWENNSEYSISIQDNQIVLSANKAALISFAKQMLYLADNELPDGSHVHYDGFFVCGLGDGMEFTIEKRVSDNVSVV